MASTAPPRKERGRDVLWRRQRKSAAIPASPFGIWLQSLLDERDLSRADLIGRAGLAVSTVYKLFEYRDPLPDPGTVILLADALEVPVVEFYARLGYLDQRSADLLRGVITSPVEVYPVPDRERA